MVDYAALAEQQAIKKMREQPSNMLQPPSNQPSEPPQQQQAMRRQPDQPVPVLGPSMSGVVNQSPVKQEPPKLPEPEPAQAADKPDYAALAEKKYRQSYLDNADISDTGAPALVRAAVGAAVTPEDRLATLRKSFPDAVAHGDDNFVYTDPETGQLTRFNPKGLDWGDWAGAAPEIGEFAGGLLGGAAGTAVAPGIGTVAGTGLGAAAGRGLVQQGAEWLLGTEDTRSTGEQAADLAVTGGLNAVGAKLAPIVGKAASGFKNAVKSPFVKNTPEELTQDFARLRVTPSAGQITNNRFQRTVESILPNTPGGAPVMQRAAEVQNEQLANALSNTIAKSGGQVRQADELGDIVQSGIKAGFRGKKDNATALYDKAYDAIGADTPVQLQNVAALRNEIADQVAAAPQSSPAHLHSTLDQLNGIIKDSSARGGYSFEAARRLMAEVNELARAAPEAGNPAQGLQKRMAAALKRDIGTTVENQGGRAAKLYDQANRYYAKRVGADKDFVNKITSDKKTAQMVGNEMLKPRPDPQRILQARKQLSPDEWNDVVATKINQMGMATPGGQNATGDVFSVNQFLTNWNRMPDNSKKAMFGGSRYAEMRQDLDRLSRITSSIKEGGKVGNPSGTAHHMAYMTLLGGATYGISEGDAGATAGAIAAGVVAPNVAARLITNPRFIKWLSKTPKATAAPGGKAKHLAQLYMIGQVNPDIRDSVQSFIDQASKIEVPETQKEAVK